MKQITVCSREDALYFTAAAPWACISVASEPGAWPSIDATNRVGLLQLAFADLESPVADARLFNEADAERILDFVGEVRPRIERLMVHCEAGASRSPAIAAAISRVYFGEDREFFRFGVYDPNRLVYHTLIDVARARGQFHGRTPRRR
jgi:predicted protein tyrosine phosphatase